MNVSRFRLVVSTCLLLSTFGSTLLSAASADEVASLRQKATDGNFVAQYNLGLIYADPQEASYDRLEAYVWLMIAAENGTTGRALTTLVEQLTPAELAEGKRRLDERRPNVFMRPRPATIVRPAPVVTPTPVPAVPTINVDQSPASAPASANTEALRTAQAELERLRGELATQQARATQAASQAEPLRDEVVRIQTELDSLIRQLQEARDELARTSAASNELATLRPQLDQWRENAVAARAELERLRNSQSSASDSQLRTAAAEKEALSASLAQERSRIEALTSQATAAAEEARQAAAAKAAAEQRL